MICGVHFLQVMMTLLEVEVGLGGSGEAAPGAPE